MAFCVYSGRGISQLRNHLTELFDSMNETNGTDDTEYEDDDYEIFNDDGTPEPDAENDMDEAPPVPSPAPINVTTQRGGRSAPSQPQAHEFVFNRDRPPRAATIPTSNIGPGRQGSNVPPSVNILGATSRLNAHIQDGTAIPVVGPSRRGRQVTDADQTITDMLPIVETPSGSTGDRPGFQFNGYSAPDQHYAEMGHQQGYQPQIMQPQMQPPHYEHYAAPDADTTSSPPPNTMDVDQWSVVDGTPYAEGTAGPSGLGEGSGNQWNVGRTLRGVFHFGRSPNENIYQQYPPQPPPSGGARPRH
jgi:F-box and leucine-rich repeat protein GRR1